jgi:hypothetical protein
MRLARNEDVPQVPFAGRVVSNNREQHLGRSFPQTNGSFKIGTAEIGRRTMPDIPILHNTRNPKQAYAQPKVSKGQQMPSGRAIKKNDR